MTEVDFDVFRRAVAEVLRRVDPELFGPHAGLLDTLSFNHGDDFVGEVYKAYEEVNRALAEGVSDEVAFRERGPFMHDLAVFSAAETGLRGDAVDRAVAEVEGRWMLHGLETYRRLELKIMANSQLPAVSG